MDKKFLYIVGGGLLAVIILIIVIVVLNKGGGKPPVVSNKTFVVWDYNNEKAAYDSILTDFQKNNNIKVTYVNKSKGTYLEDAINAIAANNGPDVMIAPNDIMPQFKDKLVPMPDGSLADASAKQNDLEVYQNRYPDVVYQNNILDNKIYAVPMSIASLKMYVNTGWFNTKLNEYRLANPRDPKNDQMQALLQNGINNWDDFVTLIRFFTKKSGDKLTAPAAVIGTSDNIPRAPDLLTVIMMQNGARMVSEDLSTALFHTKQNMFSNIDYPGTKGLEYYISFADPKSDNYTWNSAQGDAIRAFAEQKVPIMFDYSAAKSEVSLISPGFNYTVLNIPQIRETRNPVNFARFDNLVVPKSTKNAKLSWKFIFFATDQINSIDYFVITEKQSALNIPADDPLRYAKGWYNPNTIKVDEIFRTVIKQVNEGKDPQTALDGAAGQITTLLGKLK